MLARREGGALGTGRLSPWLDACVRPRPTLRAILDEDPRRHVLALTVLPPAAGATAALLEAAADRGTSQPASIVALAPIVLALAIAAAVVLGAAYGLATRISGWLLGGTGRYRETRCAVAWAGVPMIATGIVGIAVAPVVALAHPRIGAAFLVLLGVAAIACAVGVLLAGIAEAHRFSRARAAASAVLGLVLLDLAACLAWGLASGLVWTLGRLGLGHA